MPGKSRRVASRQAQLNQRRKKQQRGPRGIPTAEPDAPVQNGHTRPAVTTQTLEQGEPAPTAVATRGRPSDEPARPSPVSRTVGSPRARREQLNTVNYVGAELRRILILASAVFAVIIGLAVVLPIIV